MQPQPRAHSLGQSQGWVSCLHWVSSGCLSQVLQLWGRRRPYKGMAPKVLMGKERSPGEEEHTEVGSGGFHTLARGELSFFLPVTTSEMQIQSFRRFAVLIRWKQTNWTRDTDMPWTWTSFCGCPAPCQLHGQTSSLPYLLEEVNSLNMGDSALTLVQTMQMAGPHRAPSTYVMTVTETFTRIRPRMVEVFSLKVTDLVLLKAMYNLWKCYY